MVGIDIAKDFHVAQAATCRGVVLSRHALRVSNSAEGFAHLLEAVRQWQATYQLSDVIVGMESTGHYWLNLAHWLTDHGLEVVLVNPATTKRNKENRDNSPAKNDRNDAAVIADLVGRGYYAPYQFPAPIFARLQVLVKARERLVGDGTRLQNRLHGWLDVWFPEYASVFGDLVSPRSLATLHRFPTPADLHGLSPDQVVEDWRDQGMARPGGAVGRRVAQALLTVARGSIGNAQALIEAKAELGWLLQQYDALRAQQTVFEDQITALLPEVPGADVLPSVGLSPLQCGTLLGYAGDLSRFDHGNQLLRLAGMNLITSVRQISGESDTVQTRQCLFAQSAVLERVESDPTFARLPCLASAPCAGSRVDGHGLPHETHRETGPDSGGLSANAHALCTARRADHGECLIPPPREHAGDFSPAPRRSPRGRPSRGLLSRDIAWGAARHPSRLDERFAALIGSPLGQPPGHHRIMAS